MERQKNTEVQEACKLIHKWNEFFLGGRDPPVGPPGLVVAVATVKRYLERERADGKPIRELEVAEHLLATREGIRWVLPFVLSAESMEASRRRTTPG